MTVCGWKPETAFWRRFPYYVNFSSAGLSAIGSLIVMIIYLLQFKRQRKNLVATFLFCMSIADLLASVGILTSQGILFFDSTLSTPLLCRVLRTIIQFGFLASFAWTSCISFFLYSSTQQFAEKPHRIIAMHVVSWGIPLTLVVIQVAAGGIVVIPETNWCSSSKPFEWAIWIAPLFISFSFNAVMYILILRYNSRRFAHADHPGTEAQKQLQSVAQRRITFYILIFLLCWTCDVLNHILDFIFDCDIFVLWVLQTLFAPLQGFLNFIVYGTSTNLLQWSNWKKMKTLKASDYEARHLLSRQNISPTSSAKDMTLA
eukprot:TRINITY_DN11301_c0_g1_i1.p1 TRINITY_DN11301_c0_g1~~TRINITY_DN11301_c0_g1_i1.p1  ORF type:complete len:316 (-),score=43.60 TRINITY_DN11301_c0_g1_i1:44-991(-)